MSDALEVPVGLDVRDGDVPDTLGVPERGER